MLFRVGIYICFLIGVASYSNQQASTPTILYSKQSPFGLIEVVATEEPGVLKICENKIYDVIHSTFMQGDPTYLGLLYVPLSTISFCYAKNLKKVLLLGLGAGDFLSYMMKYFPNTEVDAVEINPVMIDIVKKFREQDMQKAPRYFCEDGFKYIDKIKRKYDLIFCDMYFGKPAISQNYKDLFEKLKNCLEEGGAFIFNAYLPFMPRAVIGDMLKCFDNSVAIIAKDGANIVFICYQGSLKRKEGLEKIAQEMQSKYNFRYPLDEQAKQLKLISPADHETWVSKFPVLE